MGRGWKPRGGVVVRAVVVVMLVSGPILMVASGMGLYLHHPTSTRGCVDNWALMGPFIGGSFLLVSSFLILCITCCDSDIKGKQQPDLRLLCSLVLCLLYAIIGSLAVSIHLLASVSTENSHWLPSDINSTDNWKYNKRCLYHTNVCNRLQQPYENDTLAQFSSRPLSPIQSGCCKPPEDCHFIYKSPTTWIKSKNGSYANPDYLAWDNDPKKLCYNCQLCKLGVAHEAKKQRTVAGATTLAGSLIMILGCCLLIIFTHCS